MTSPLAIQAAKEARGIVPWALLFAISILAMAWVGARHAGFPYFRQDLLLVLVTFHGLGLFAIGALSIGQEFTHGTFGMLLMQPESRRKLLTIKLGVLATVVVLLALLAESTFPERGPRHWLEQRSFWIWVPATAAVGLVPLLTLLTRRTIGGIVFAAVVPWLLFTIAEVSYPGTFDKRVFFTIAGQGTALVSGLGLLILLFAFSRFELQGATSDIRSVFAGALSSSPAETTRSRRHWTLNLLIKELRLQQLTFAVTALYILGASAIMIAQREPASVGLSFEAISLVFGCVVPIIVGATASAEERHMGTIAAESLHPIAGWRPWLIKAGVTMSLASSLAIGLPLLLTTFHQPVNPLVIDEEFALGVLLVAVGALYVSSLSTTTLRALLTSIPALAGAFVVYMSVMHAAMVRFRFQFAWTDRALTEMRANNSAADWPALMGSVRAVRNVESLAVLISLAGLALLVLYLAGRNHRSLDRSGEVIAGQVLTLAAGAAGVVLIVVAASRIAGALLQ